MLVNYKYIFIITILLVLIFHGIVASSLILKPILWNIEDNEVDFIYKMAHVMVLNPTLIKVIDFDDVDNSSLQKLLVKTYYSRNVIIPSNQVYIRDGCLYLTGTEHLVINTSYVGLNNTNYVLVKALVKWVSGGYEGFSRGGIGFYGTTDYDTVNDYYVAAPYWLSVIGSFNTSEPVSYDFEGHITWLKGEWGFSESANNKIYKYNTTYEIWIARIDNYIIGGINAYPRSWIFYINGTYYLPEVVSHAGTVCIRRIEFYNLSEGEPKTKTSILPSTLLDFDTFSNLSYVYLRQDICRQYIFSGGRQDPVTFTLFFFVRKTDTCLLLPYKYNINIPMIYNSGK